ncbi:hypothetical protein CHS0354_011964 [Potamilus streckersoni]|uniref:UNC93-like protein n=1 Tax=Potamilus streckersoni TaxID=2493646 RepID=A0AAE0TFG4_9BIVA|nr:hypothetical protein CHS0354_011964 [Potamilus streckersoni]
MSSQKMSMDEHGSSDNETNNIERSRTEYINPKNVDFSHIEPLIPEVSFGEARNTDEPSTMFSQDCDNSKKVLKPQMTKSRIWKNLLVISFGFLLLLTAYNSLESLQSSLNTEGGLGTTCLAVLYGTFLISCITVSPIADKYMGSRLIIPLSMSCYVLFVAANFHADWFTLVPGSVIIGIGAGCLWTAQNKYVTSLGVQYAALTGANEKAVLSRFFGIFFGIMKSCIVIGNLLASMVLKQRSVKDPDVNASHLQFCGASYCPSSSVNASNLERPEISTVYILCGTYLALACAGVIIVAIFLDKVDPDSHVVNNGVPRIQSTMRLISDSFRLLVTSRLQKLLLPLSFYEGFCQAFLSGDITVSFISCVYGIEHVGYIMISVGVVATMSSFLFGRLVKWTRQTSLYIFVYVLHIVAAITMLLWKPGQDEIYVVYILASMWSMGTAIFQMLTTALYGYLFKDASQAAFTVYRVFSCSGAAVAYGLTVFLCMEIKIFLCLGIIATCFISIMLINVTKRHQKEETNVDQVLE